MCAYSMGWREWRRERRQGPDLSWVQVGVLCGRWLLRLSDASAADQAQEGMGAIAGAFM